MGSRLRGSDVAMPICVKHVTVAPHYATMLLANLLT